MGNAIGGSGAPSGPAGGDLAGTYPDPQVYTIGLQPSGDATGATDTANIQALLNAAAPGGTVTLAAGTFNTNAPITIPPYTVLAGSRGGISAFDMNTTVGNYGSVLKPVAGWASALAVSGIVTLLDCQSGGYTSPPGTNAGVNGGVRIRNILFDGTASPASVDGIAAYGAVAAVEITDVGMISVTGNGISGKHNSSSTATDKSPDGWHVSHVMIQSAGANGVGGIAGQGDGIFNDSVFIDVHAQSCSQDGFHILNGNTFLIGCRAEFCSNGYTIDSANATGIGLGIRLIGCTTDSNVKNGLNVINSSTTGTTSRNVVQAAGCQFHADGANGGAGGGGYAGVLVSGVNTVELSNCVVAVDTGSVAGGCPQYGLATASAGSGPGVPVYVQVSGGLLNGATAPVNDAAPSAFTRIDPAAATLTGIFSATLTPYRASAAAFLPGNPTPTSSLTEVMMGLGTTCTYTPTGSGQVLVTVTGYATTATGVAQVALGPRFGTGTAPANGAGVTGTRFGTGADPALRAAALGTSAAFAFTALLALTPSTAYWFDVALETGNASDAATITDVAMTFAEQ